MEKCGHLTDLNLPSPTVWSLVNCGCCDTAHTGRRNHSDVTLSLSLWAPELTGSYPCRSVASEALRLKTWTPSLFMEPVSTCLSSSISSSMYDHWLLFPPLCFHGDPVSSRPCTSCRFCKSLCVDLCNVSCAHVC